MKHKHHDLIVQWAKDTSQKVWVWDKWKDIWKEVQKPNWYDHFIYKIQEDRPIEYPAKKVSFFDGGIEFDVPAGGIDITKDTGYSGTAFSLKFYEHPVGTIDSNLYFALKELVEKRLEPQQGT